MKKQSVMVCVTTQKTCERLIRAGAEVARPTEAALHVVHVTKIGDNFLNNAHEAEALDYLFGVSKQYGADMTVLRSDNVAFTLADHAKRLRARDVIFGQSPEAATNPYNVIAQVQSRLAGDNIHVRVFEQEG